jgi:hypothetical protein
MCSPGKVGLAALAIVLTVTSSYAQSDGIHAQVVPVKHDESVALSTVPASVPKAKGKTPDHPVKPGPPLPKRGPGKAPAKSVVQSNATTTLDVTAPQGFGGIGDGDKYQVAHIPSDTTGAIGDTQYVQWVNEAVQIFDRNGKSVYGPTLGNNLWLKFGGACEKTNDGDPIVQYDKAAHRWMLTQFAVDGGPPFSQCIAISASPDATGKYQRYAVSFDKFNDYPKVGVWGDAYYISFNMFDGDDSFGSKICALNRADAMAGKATAMQCFDTEEFGVIPADVDGTTPPPAGSPGLAMNFTRDALQLWQIRVDWDHPELSRMTGPVAIPVAQFDPACDVAPCIPQKPVSGKNAPLFSMGDRLMYRVAYRNFGDHESLVVNHAVQVNPQDKPASGVRWYEIRDPRGTPIVLQQATYAPGMTTARWLGSPAMDKNGNLLIGYSTSTPSGFAVVALAGRRSGDPANVLSKELTVKKGVVTSLGKRWGDYSTMSVDPTDDCTFWFTTEVMSSADRLWQTHVVHTKFNDCK